MKLVKYLLVAVLAIASLASAAVKGNDLGGGITELVYEVEPDSTFVLPNNYPNAVRVLSGGTLIINDDINYSGSFIEVKGGGLCTIIDDFNLNGSTFKAFDNSQLNIYDNFMVNASNFYAYAGSNIKYTGRSGEINATNSSTVSIVGISTNYVNMDALSTVAKHRGVIIDGGSTISMKYVNMDKGGIKVINDGFDESKSIYFRNLNLTNSTEGILVDTAADLEIYQSTVSGDGNYSSMRNGIEVRNISDKSYGEAWVDECGVANFNNGIVFGETSSLSDRVPEAYIINCHIIDNFTFGIRASDVNSGGDKDFDIKYNRIEGNKVAGILLDKSTEAYIGHSTIQQNGFASTEVLTSPVSSQIYLYEQAQGEVFYSLITPRMTMGSKKSSPIVRNRGTIYSSSNKFKIDRSRVLFSSSLGSFVPEASTGWINITDPQPYLLYRHAPDWSWDRSGKDVAEQKPVMNSVEETTATLNNFPNPFNPTTEINYTLSNAGMVNLTIYNSNGQSVANLVQNVQKSTGTHNVMFDGAGLTSGVYYSVLKVNNKIASKSKMVLMK
jgi:hypothetical protein